MTSAVDYSSLVCLRRQLLCELLLVYRPLTDERLSWPCWLTYSRQFTHNVQLVCINLLRCDMDVVSCNNTTQSGVTEIVWSDKNTHDHLAQPRKRVGSGWLGSSDVSEL